MAEIILVNALNLIVDKVFDELETTDASLTKVVWFGLTDYVNIVQRALISRGKRIHYIIDNAADKWGTVLEGDLIVFPVEQIINACKENMKVLIASRFKEEMRKQLLEMGVSESEISFLPYHDECEAWAKNILLTHTNGLKKIELREMQLIMLELLKKLRDFCNTNGLRYFLAAGTLLGAVRHKGFIPWDDDADVYMPLNDYKKFIESFPDDSRYKIINWEKNDDFTPDFAKLLDNDTIMYHGGAYPLQWIQSVSIDIFPLCGYPKGKKKFKQKEHMNRALDAKWHYYQFARDFVPNGLQDLRREIYELKYSMPFDGAHLIGRSHIMCKPMWVVPQSVFAESIPIEFEGELFSAPVGYDMFLKTHYGEYMQLPPENKRDDHGSIAFWRSKGCYA